MPLRNPGYDYNSRVLQEHDMFDGEMPKFSEEEYQRERQSAIGHRANVIDKRTPEQKKLPLQKTVDLTEYRRMLESGDLSSQGISMSSVAAKETFYDNASRRIDFILTKAGGISIQFWLLDGEPVHKFWELLNKKLNYFGMIPKKYKWDVRILSAMHSINIFFEPQKFDLGFMTMLRREIQKLVM